MTIREPLAESCTSRGLAWPSIIQDQLWTSSMIKLEKGSRVLATVDPSEKRPDVGSCESSTRLAKPLPFLIRAAKRACCELEATWFISESDLMGTRAGVWACDEAACEGSPSSSLAPPSSFGSLSSSSSLLSVETSLDSYYKSVQTLVVSSS